MRPCVASSAPITNWKWRRPQSASIEYFLQSELLNTACLAHAPYLMFLMLLGVAIGLMARSTSGSSPAAKPSTSFEKKSPQSFPQQSSLHAAVYRKGALQ